jgi:hypothetical protein
MTAPNCVNIYSLTPYMMITPLLLDIPKAQSDSSATHDAHHASLTKKSARIELKFYIARSSMSTLV